MTRIVITYSVQDVLSGIILILIILLEWKFFIEVMKILSYSFFGLLQLK